MPDPTAPVDAGPAPDAAPAPVDAAPATPPAGEAPSAAETPTPAAPGAPDKYEFKAPEGQTFDDGVLGKFAEVAKALNLPQDGAQRILDEVAPALQARSMRALTEFYADIGGMPDTWAETVKADKELGGAALDRNLATAKKALDLGGESLTRLLTKTGLGNHPDVIRWAVRIGKSLSEDNFVSGGSTPAAQTDAASRLYGKN
jgi:hypothetical protein